MNKVKLLLISLFVLGSIASVNAQNERKYIRRGNSAYNKAVIDSVTVDSTKYADAENYYRKALEEDPNNWDASYNLANALFRQGKLEDAARQYQAVAQRNIDSKTKRANAYHNLGNCMLMGNNLQAAIEAFKESLRNDPTNLETKYNLAWAQNKLKEQQDQQNEQNQNQNQNQDQQQDQQNQDNQQDQNQNQDNKQDQQKQDSDQNQDQQQNQQNQNQQNQNQDQQQGEQNEHQMSKEDAMRILEALENDEKDVQDKVQKQKAKPVQRRTQKDW